jgi:enoyl-CoA hydratase
MADYSRYKGLEFEMLDDEVLRVAMISGNAAAQHTDLADIWPEIDRDPDVRVILVGQGPPVDETLSTYGKEMMDLSRTVIMDWDTRMKVMQEAADLVYNMLNCKKPIVAMYPGAFAPIAVQADVSITTKDAVWRDQHVGYLGCVAGDYSVMSWPLHIGMAKAKYHLMTSEQFSGQEAYDWGLVSLVVDDEEALEAKGREVATKLARGSQRAIRWTKQALNNHYRQNGAAFDASLAWEFITLGRENPDVLEGLEATVEGRQPNFPEKLP